MIVVKKMVGVKSLHGEQQDAPELPVVTQMADTLLTQRAGGTIFQLP